MFDLHINGPIGLLILIADIYAIVKTVQSNVGTLTKVLWIVAILFLPVLGFLLWLIFGPRS
jgi:phospholipase D-like protein